MHNVHLTCQSEGREEEDVSNICDSNWSVCAGDESRSEDFPSMLYQARQVTFLGGDKSLSSIYINIILLVEFRIYVSYQKVS